MKKLKPIKILRAAEKELANGLAELPDDHVAVQIIRELVPMTKDMAVTDIVVGDKGDEEIYVWVRHGDVRIMSQQHIFTKTAVREAMGKAISRYAALEEELSAGPVHTAESVMSLLEALSDHEAAHSRLVEAVKAIGGWCREISADLEALKNDRK